MKEWISDWLTKPLCIAWVITHYPIIIETEEVVWHHTTRPLCSTPGLIHIKFYISNAAVMINSLASESVQYQVRTARDGCSAGWTAVVVAAMGAAAVRRS